MTVELLKRVDSTNNYVQKYIKRRQNAIICAEEQTAGAGTKGRSFISSVGGIYMTKLKFYEFLVNSAMAVVATLAAFDITAGIKWPNDVIVNGKKICGILIKNALQGDLVDYSVIGIGLNVNNEISSEIRDIATSVSLVLGKEVDKESVFFTLMQNLEQEYDISQYKKYSLLLGKKVTILRGENTFEAQVLDVLEDGRLLLTNGEALSAGEIDLKILADL